MTKKKVEVQQQPVGKRAKRTIKIYAIVYVVAVIFTFLAPFTASTLSDALALLLLCFIAAFISPPLLLIYHVVKFMKAKDYQVGRYHIQMSAFLICCALVEAGLIYYWVHKYDR